MLADEKCVAATRLLSEAEIAGLLAQLDGWSCDHGKLVKVFGFRDYHETIAFVNASAWVSHREDHHPELTVAYNRCRVAYDTHSVRGLSRNDFICAAKLDGLL